MLEGRPFEHDVRRAAARWRRTRPSSFATWPPPASNWAPTRGGTPTSAASLDEERLHDEIVGSKRDLEAIIGRAVRYFAFPFGLHANLSQAAFRIAFRAGYWGVCSAYGGYNLPGDDPFHIHRIHGDPSWSRFCNWMTADPRSCRRIVQRFNPGEYRMAF